MKVAVEGIGVWTGGITGWADYRVAAQAAMPAAAPAEPPAAGLSPQERRRSIATVRLAVEVAGQACAAAGREPRECAMVFASSAGDLDTLNAICGVLARDARLLSPTRFHNSVHNAPAGYWSIAGGCELPATSLAAGAETFAAALLEAASQCVVERRPVLLVVYDLPGPEPLASVCPIDAAFGAALVLAPDTGETACAALGIEIASGAGAVGDDSRCGNPAARCRPLLDALAHGQSASLEYTLGRSVLRLRVEPAGATTRAADSDRVMS